MPERYTPSAHEVETFSGRFVDVSKPDPETINLEDIAHALAQTCRYGGHCQAYYSVAEHAVFVSRRLERKGFSNEVQLAGLHHDDAEAYLGDIPRPIKPLLGRAYIKMTDDMDAAICDGLALPFTPAAFHGEEIKAADNWSLFVEARNLLPSQGRGWWGGGQGSDDWELGGLPSKIIIPDYFYAGLPTNAANVLYLDRHAELAERISA